MPKKGPSPNSPTRPHRLAPKARQEKVLELRIQGHSFRAIAAALDVSPATITTDLASAMEALAEQSKAQASILRDLEDARLDLMLLALQPEIEKGNPQSINVALRIQDRRSKLWGLDKITPGKSLQDALREALAEVSHEAEV